MDLILYRIAPQYDLNTACGNTVTLLAQERNLYFSIWGRRCGYAGRHIVAAVSAISTRHPACASAETCTQAREGAAPVGIQASQTAFIAS